MKTSNENYRYNAINVKEWSRTIDLLIFNQTLYTNWATLTWCLFYQTALKKPGIEPDKMACENEWRDSLNLETDLL